MFSLGTETTGTVLQASCVMEEKNQWRRQRRDVRQRRKTELMLVELWTKTLSRLRKRCQDAFLRAGYLTESGRRRQSTSSKRATPLRFLPNMVRLLFSFFILLTYVFLLDSFKFWSMWIPLSPPLTYSTDLVTSWDNKSSLLLFDYYLACSRLTIGSTY